jgi:hypothetical protein
MAFGALFLLRNSLLARRLLLRLSLLVLPVHVLGLVAHVALLWAHWARMPAHKRRSVRAALLGFGHSGGWPGAGVSALVGMYGPM